MAEPDYWEILRTQGRDIYAVLGWPVGHSLSPAMHNAAFNDLGLPAVYVPFEVKPGTLKDELGHMAAAGVRGANITVPLKEEAFEAMDHLDDLSLIHI